MKIVERSNRNKYLFECPKCGALLEASGKELEFLKPGRLTCTCIDCKEEIVIKERKITIYPVYQAITD